MGFPTPGGVVPDRRRRRALRPRASATRRCARAPAEGDAACDAATGGASRPGRSAPATGRDGRGVARARARVPGLASVSAPCGEATGRGRARGRERLRRRVDGARGRPSRDRAATSGGAVRRGSTRRSASSRPTRPRQGGCLLARRRARRLARALVPAHTRQSTATPSSRPRSEASTRPSTRCGCSRRGRVEAAVAGRRVVPTGAAVASSGACARRSGRREASDVHALRAGRAVARKSCSAMGDPDADLMFVGEGPGAEEDQQGLPFVGPVREAARPAHVEEIGITRDDVLHREHGEVPPAG